jgi:phage/plasmid-associated DNA primase
MRLLKLLDDTPVVPGDVRPAYEHGAQARQILNDAEDDLRDWQPELEESSPPQQQQERLTQKTSRGSADYTTHSRDSGYDVKDTDYVRDSTTTTTTAEPQQHMSGASGAPVSEEELRGEQRVSSSPSPGQPEAAASARSSGRSGSRGLFSVVAEI